MLTAIRLGNFKAFADTQRMPIRPLTLIFGANSAGKSSLIHGLLLARHALETGELDVYRTAIGGESVDLGGFRQYVHRRDAARRVEWGAEIDVARLPERLVELLAPVRHACVSLSIGMKLDDLGNPVRDSAPLVITYDIEADGVSILRMSRRPDGNLQLDRLEHTHPVFREVLKAIVETATTTESLTPSDDEGVGNAIADLVPEIRVQSGKFLPGELLRSDEFPEPGSQVMLFPISRDRRKEDLAAAIRVYLPHILNELIQGINEAVADELTYLHYLGPLRSYPPRHLAFAQYHDPNWFAGGGYAWDVVRHDEEVRNAVNAWLGSEDRLQSPYELVVRKLVSREEMVEIIGDFIMTVGRDWDREPLIYDDAHRYIKNYLDDFSQLDEVPDLVMRDRRTNTVVSHRDVGIGISQVLPVLVMAYGHTNQICAIEQPEIHLHPALQAELGDVFIESTLGEKHNTFIIETHSEHLILRLLRRIRETTDGELEDGLTPITPEDVCVLYAKATPNGTTLIEIPVTPDGEFETKWPDGFFAERAKELF